MVSPEGRVADRACDKKYYQGKIKELAQMPAEERDNGVVDEEVD